MGSNIIDEIDCSSFFDHFDDLIDFPADTECGGDGLNSGDLTDFSSLWDNTLPETTPLFPENKNSASDLSTEIAVPYEDIVQLEWLSTFVEESFADGGLTIPVENSVVVKNEPTEPPPAAQFQTSSPISVLESSASSGSSCSVTLGSGPAKRGPQRARSKRPRPATFNPRAAMIHLVNPETQGVENFAESKPIKKPKTEKKKKTPLEVTNPTGTLRKCLHCEITKTPQWRAGPMGPKTLCNACGVRYKSGRLFPEYRPAASPTFVPTLHSNSHKKVIEMRVKVTEIPSPTPKVTEIPSPTPKVAEPELVVPVTSAAPPALAPALE